MAIDQRNSHYQKYIEDLFRKGSPIESSPIGQDRWSGPIAPDPFYYLNWNIFDYRQYVVEIPQKDTTISRSCPCPVAVQVANKILDRADHGFKKYGATLDRGDLTLRDWANHLQEELMDATDYLQVIINKMDQLEKELGK